MLRSVTAILILLLAASGCRERSAQRSVPERPPAASAVHLSMAALHASGGVPPNWRFSPPPGDPRVGRDLFARLGCPTCHVVGGESFPAPTGVGPELTGMGSHHPAGYFAESIVNPDAVIVDGAGYTGPDGHSVMPTYPDLTVEQLADLVAYLQTMTDPRGAMHPTATTPRFPEKPLQFPKPPDQERTAFLA